MCSIREQQEADLGHTQPQIRQRREKAQLVVDRLGGQREHAGKQDDVDRHQRQVGQGFPPRRAQRGKRRAAPYRQRKSPEQHRGHQQRQHDIARLGSKRIHRARIRRRMANRELRPAKA